MNALDEVKEFQKRDRQKHKAGKGLGKLYRCENCGATLTAAGVIGTTGWIESRCCETDATEMTGRIHTCHTCRRPYGENEAQPTDNAGMVSPCCGN